MGGNAHAESTDPAAPPVAPLETPAPAAVETQPAKVLACNCDGDCTHWEVSTDGPRGSGFIKCKTCGLKLVGDINIYDAAMPASTTRVDEK